MTNNDEVVNPSRRWFLKGRISPKPTESSSEINVELIGVSRELDSDLTTSVIKYSVVNSGTKRISILVRYILGKHFQVIKNMKEGETYTEVQSLNKKERINEIARMLAGMEVKNESRANAEKMLALK